MASVGDVVKLSDGSVGVVSEIANGVHRVHFVTNHKDVNTDFISATLSAPNFNVGDEVALWPYSGTITAIEGDDFTLSIDRQQRVEGLGPITWMGTYKSPRWRIALDNDARIKRIW